jgi:hypothetical protein
MRGDNPSTYPEPQTGTTMAAGKTALRQDFSDIRVWQGALYEKYGFLEQTNDMGCYSGDALKSAVQGDVLRHVSE